MSQPETKPNSPVSNAYPRGTGVRLGIAVVILAIALIIGFIIVNRVKAHQKADLASDTINQTDAPQEVSVVRVSAAPSSQILQLPGETAAWYQSTIYARVSGYVKNWTADIGDRVKKDQTLATIDTPDLDDQLAASRAKANASQANVGVMQANVALAKTTYDRWWNSPKALVSDQEREEKKAMYESSVAQLTAAQAQVNLDKAGVDQLTAMTAFKAVTAPFDGIITARRIDIGDLVTAGSTASTTSLYTIAQTDRLRIFVDVPQQQSLGIFDGMAASAVAEGYPDQKFLGKVARTSRAINPMSRTLRVEVDVPNGNLVLMPGVYVQVSFELAHKPFVQVRASALIFRAAGPQVAVVKNGRIDFRDVTIGSDHGDVIDIAAGLSPGDEVALNVSDQIAQGDAVNVAQADQPPGGASPPPAGAPASPSAGAVSAATADH